MLLEALFAVYVIALFIFVVLAGICHLRISAQLKGSHAIVTQLFPVFITVLYHINSVCVSQLGVLESTPSAYFAAWLVHPRQQEAGECAHIWANRWGCCWQNYARQNDTPQLEACLNYRL